MGSLGEVDGFPVVDEGWTAATVVDDDGDPLAVIDDYLRQAEETGLEDSFGLGCLADHPYDGEVLCAGFARNGDASDPRSLSVEFIRGRRAGVVANHVLLRYSTTDRTWASGPSVTTGDRSVSIPAPPPWPPLPAVGEELPDNGETFRLLTVQPGSRVAGPLWLNLNDGTGGFAGIFEVTGDPQEVFAAYVDHLADLGPTGPEPSTWTSGTARVTRAFADEAGGDLYQLTMVERPGRSAWLAVEASHD